MSHATQRLDVGDAFPAVTASSVGHGSLTLPEDLFDAEVYDGFAARRGLVLIYRAHW